ncbi:RNA-directed DNA polymerase from mobile element jockey [Amphibalanus amphitrite]|uniref:RNA-directed DNA polymerase from mobile element jockey n=1 Tax=Amphibalanus amphitrite TaxID=1232801 RepID=A0A6A4VM53_AMPAM|nr:RNA-directed DNA polymerase from mobile element jockey [Amphibalanus amphitrite]
MVTLRAALNHLLDHPHQPSAPITICSDSQSALATLREGPASQKTLLGAAIWTELAALAGPSRRIHLQWVPSHCGVDGNERADQIAEAAALPQAAVPVDVPVDVPLDHERSSSKDKDEVIKRQLEEMQQQKEKQQALMNTKVALDAEISAFNKLLESKNTSIKKLCFPPGLSESCLTKILENSEGMEELLMTSPSDSTGQWARLLPSSLKKLDVFGPGETGEPLRLVRRPDHGLVVVIRQAGDDVINQLAKELGPRATGLVMLKCPRVTAGALQRLLSALTGLEDVTLGGSLSGAITDASLAALHGCSQLDTIQLGDSVDQCTDIPVKAVSRLVVTCRKLDWLSLDTTDELSQRVLDALVEADLGKSDDGKPRTLKLLVEHLFTLGLEGSENMTDKWDDSRPGFITNWELVKLRSFSISVHRVNTTAQWGRDRTRRADSSTLHIGHINARSLIPKMDEVNRMLQEQGFDILCINAIMQASAKHIPRGARADPKPWALDPELERAVAERREARAALDQSPTPENREAWKRAKKKVAETEEEARKRAFRTFATEELNQHTNLGRITKLLRKMEGGVQSTAPGQAINGDRGREAVEDRSKAEAFVATYAAVSKHDGITADKFVLVAYDFARAYDTIDHKMLQNKLLRHLPKCLVTWIFQLLRDRRACVEVNGVRSRDRPFRAGLPQGSVLAPTLYTLWAADLIEELRKMPRTDCYMYADDTATVSAGPNIQMALSRAQQSADMMARWATKNKMNIAGHKTQILVLSQWAPDAKNVTLKVAGSDVTATSHVKLLGVTLDRLLHFGEHCASLRRKVRPRTAQLRKLTGHSWGLREHHLRTVANGYVRGALEYAAAAWLPAASPSHVELVDRELRAAARAVTGCPMSTPTHGLMAEAGMATAEMRRTTLATRMVMRAASLPPDDPLRAVATATQHSRLSAVRGWRELGRNTLRDLGALDVPTTQLGATIWQQLLLLVERGRPVHLQWVPAHCGLAGNERADAIAKEAAGMDQSNAPIDTRSATRAAARSARRQWQRAWPDGWYKEIFGEEHLPGPVSGDNRMAAVDTHQLRAGHWSQSAQYLHRIGRRPTDTCQGCADTECPAARCLVCGEEADTPRHVLLRCPCLCGTRLHALGNMHGVRQYGAALHELGLFQLVRVPTHLEPSESLIDHVITNVPDLDADVLPPADAVADHLTVTVRVPFRRESRRPAPFTARSWRKVNWDAVCLDFLRADWSAVYNAAALDDKVGR